MALLGRILLPAVIAGLIAGAFLTGLQHIEVIPLIYEAETYENPAASGHTHDSGAGDAHETESRTPDNGLERAALNKMNFFSFFLLYCFSMKQIVLKITFTYMYRSGT